MMAALIISGALIVGVVGSCKHSFDKSHGVWTREPLGIAIDGSARNVAI